MKTKNNNSNANKYSLLLFLDYYIQTKKLLAVHKFTRTN